MNMTRGRRIAATSFLAVAVLFLTAFVRTPVDAKIQVICSGVTSSDVAKCDPGYAAVMHKMHWRMYSGHNCTNYVAYRLGANGVPEPKILMGNARDWEGNAKKLGYRVDSKPAVGSVGVWTGKNHLVYVAEVGDGYIVTREDHYPGYYPKGLYQNLKVYTGDSSYPQRFIHFRDLATGPAPQIAGTSRVGSTLTSTTGTWQPAGLTFTNQWLRDGKAISGANRSTYRLLGLDLGHTISLKLTGSKPGFLSTAKVSARTAPIGVGLAPTRLTASARAVNSLDLTWDAVAGAGAGGYRVQFSPNSNMSGARYFGFASNRGTVSGLSPGTRYYFRVVVVDAKNKVKWSEYTAKPYPNALTYLPTPSNLRGTSETPASLTLKWDAVAGAGGYRVQFSPNSSMSGARYFGFASNRGTVSGLSPGTRYYFRVVVVDRFNVEKLSTYSAKPYASAVTKPAVPKFSTPTKLKSTGQTPTSLSLMWNTVKGAPGYRVQISPNATMSGATYRFFTTNKGTVKDIRPGKTYYYRVSVAESRNVRRLTAYTAKPYPRTAIKWLATPGRLAASSRTSTSLTLKWNAVKGASGYRIQISPNPTMRGATYHPFRTNRGTIKRLKPRTKYYFRVSVLDATGKVRLSGYTRLPYGFAATSK